MPRVVVRIKHLTAASDGIQSRLDLQIEKKGDLSFASSHEALGVLDEEHSELKDAIRANDREAIKRELRDIVVAATWALASEAAGGWDW